MTVTARRPPAPASPPKPGPGPAGGPDRRGRLNPPRRLPPRRLPSLRGRLGSLARVPPVFIDLAAMAAVAFAVLAFSGGWSGGDLVLDGPGASLWVSIALDQIRHGGLSYWSPEVWAGTPTWALAPSLPVAILTPLAAIVGADTAVQLATVGGQVLGAWGAYVLARSLWRHRTPSIVAALLYGLHPILIAHGALAGHQPAMEVMAVTPWLAWAMRKALRGDGAHYVALAGLLAGLGVLFQPEHAYGLMLVVACIMVVQLAQSRARRRGSRSWVGVLVRTGVAGLIAIGTVAYWALPFASMSDSFVLTPPNVVRSTLVEGIGGAVGRDPSLVLSRTSGLEGVVSFNNTDFLYAGGFYLSWVCLALTLVTLGVLSRRDDDGHLTAILLASAIAVWLQTGGIPLASSGLVRSESVVGFVVIGTLAGLLVGSFLRHLRFGRWATVAGLSTALLLVAVPYFAPFLTLQQVVPLLSSVRFPRMFPIAALGLALGAANVLVLVREWARPRFGEHVQLFSAAIALALVGAFLIDIGPYRSFYHVQPPRALAAYDRVAADLAATGEGFRAAGSLDPRAIRPLLDTGRRSSTGWPHPLASRDVWRLTAEAIFVSPPGFRDAALALSATSHIVTERLAYPVEAAGPLIDNVDIEPNPLVLPMVRAYQDVVVVNDRDIAPEMAVALSQRHIGVVTGGRDAVSAAGATVRGVVADAHACRQVVPEAAGYDLQLAGEVGMACALHRWVGEFIRTDFVNLDRQGVGARFVARVDGLQGIGVWIDKPPGPTELVVYQLGPDGVSVGKELRRVRSSGYEDNGIALFSFDPIAESGGSGYIFVLSCPRCPEGEDPKLVTAGTNRAAGDLVVDGKIDTRSVVSYSLLYERIPGSEPSQTALRAANPAPGRWTVTAAGEQPALVVVAEAWFPGWSATVDGRAAPVLKADGAFLGVAVGPGDHTIRLRYDPPTIATVGRVITAVTVFCALALIAAGLGRATRRPAPQVKGASRQPPPAG